jgi:hypothetical protein
MGEEKESIEEREFERPWNSNDKLTYDNTMTHCKTVMSYGELALKESIDFQKKANDMFIAREQQRLEHDNERFKHYEENNRYTLNSLYGIYGTEEAVSLVTVLSKLVEMLEKK